MTLIEPISAPASAPNPHRFTRDEYYRMADLGFFQDRRVERLNGEILDMSPQNTPHFLAVNLVAEALRKVFGEGFWVRTQGPLALGDHSDPEPDVAVVQGAMRDFKQHPSTALLVVEVSDSTLRYDRGKKAATYAAQGIQDYWIINISAACVEILRRPIQDPPSPWGSRYQESTSFRPPEQVTPLATPGKSIPVTDLLP